MRRASLITNLYSSFNPFFHSMSTCPSAESENTETPKRQKRTPLTSLTTPRRRPGARRCHSDTYRRVALTRSASKVLLYKTRPAIAIRSKKCLLRLLKQAGGENESQKAKLPMSPRVSSLNGRDLFSLRPYRHAIGTQGA